MYIISNVLIFLSTLHMFVSLTPARIHGHIYVYTHIYICIIGHWDWQTYWDFPVANCFSLSQQLLIVYISSSRDETLCYFLFFVGMSLSAIFFSGHFRNQWNLYIIIHCLICFYYFSEFHACLKYIWLYLSTLLSLIVSRPTSLPPPNFYYSLSCNPLHDMLSMFSWVWGHPQVRVWLLRATALKDSDTSLLCIWTSNISSVWHGLLISSSLMLICPFLFFSTREEKSVKIFYYLNNFWPDFTFYSNKSCICYHYAFFSSRGIYHVILRMINEFLIAQLLSCMMY